VCVDEFNGRFPGNQEAIDLLNAMELSPEFKVGKSSDDFTSFLERIKNANPNDPSLSEDNLDASWGHYQFTAGCLTCTTVLTSWDAIGGCSNACDLIAAALKTCKVARHLCFEHNVEVMSYLSDIYLENVVSKLWDLWKSAGGVHGSSYLLSRQMHVQVDISCVSPFVKEKKELLVVRTTKYPTPNPLTRTWRCNSLARSMDLQPLLLQIQSIPWFKIKTRTTRTRRTATRD
jgi:hypothetical protein